MDEITNPLAGVMTDEQAVEKLMASSQPEAEPEDTPDVEQADQAQELEAVEETDDAADAEQEAEPEQHEEEPRYTVKVDGVEQEVTLEELTSGYQRDGDYRRKTQALADEKRAIEAEVQRQREITAQMAERLNGLGQDEKEPDWQELAKDPWEYSRVHAEWTAKQQAKQTAQAEAQRLQLEQRNAVAAEEAQKLRQRVPEYSDTAVFSKEFQDIMQTAQEVYGLAPAELERVVDHRHFLLLRDAMRFQKLQKAKPAAEKKVTKALKVQKPGTTKSKADRAAEDNDALRKNLRQRGSEDDAVAWLMRERS